MTSNSFMDENSEQTALPQAPAREESREDDSNFLRALRHHRLPTDSQTLTQTLKERLGLGQIIGESPLFMAQIKKIPIVARVDANVMIAGETGTGKEVCARAIHYLSPRAAKSFVPVNCGAIPVELLENELFGHERGAFTNAISARPGVIHEAEGGTLFLDEIDMLPLLAQVKLLRFLQEHQYRPLGATKTRQADVRIIAATNIDLEEAVRSGKLRQDLYYRLNTIPLMLPPLRERLEDIPLLVHHFLVKYATEFDKPVVGFSSDVMQILMCYEWPGNVRELEHIIQRAVVLSEKAIIQEPELILPISASAMPICQESLREAKARVIAEFEIGYIRRLLLIHQGNVTKAAQAARTNRRVFWRLMSQHGIDPHSFKDKV